MERDPRTELVVGIFVMLGVGLFVGAFFLLGSDNPVFERNYELHCSFSDISGLREGAMVRVAGMNAGTVTQIGFSESLDDQEIGVVLQMRDTYRERIREDSIATIATEGLLGDKYISITVGSPEDADGNVIPVLQHGDTIKRVNPRGLSDVLATADNVLGNLEDSTKQIKVILEGPEGESAGKSLMAIFEAIQHVVEELENGRGLIHELVYDRTTAQQYRNIMANLDNTTQRLDRVIEEVETGDGTMHALVYDDDAAAMIAEITAAADEIDGLVEDIKVKEGLLHTLIYDEGEKKNLLINLTEASADLREVTRMIRDGEGTIGALITDPTVYEDLQTLLGRAERNKILKEYVRRTIRSNEEGEGLHSDESSEPMDAGFEDEFQD